MVKNIFDHQVAQELIGRIEKLDSQKKPSWGKMTADQMLAHCNVTYEMIYDTKHPKAAGFKKFILKLLVKRLQSLAPSGAFGHVVLKAHPARPSQGLSSTA